MPDFVALTADNTPARTDLLAKQDAAGGAGSTTSSTIAEVLGLVVSTDMADFAEAVDDRVAALFGDSTTLDVTYDDAGNAISADVKDDSITFAKMQNVATDVLLGRSTAGTGDIETITCTAAARSILDDASVGDIRTTLGVGTGDTPQFQGVAIGAAGVADWLTLGANLAAFPSSSFDALAFIGKTGSTGSAPFDQAGSLIYRTRVSSTAGRSSHIFYTGSPSAERLRINEAGNLLFGTTTAPTGTASKVLAFGDNAGDPTLGTNTAGIYAKDVSGTVKLFAVDEAGNAYQIAPQDLTSTASPTFGSLTVGGLALRSLIAGQLRGIFQAIRQLTLPSTPHTGIANRRNDSFHLRQGRCRQATPLSQTLPGSGRKSRYAQFGKPTERAFPRCQATRCRDGCVQTSLAANRRRFGRQQPYGG